MSIQKILIVGAGIYGSVLARELAKAGLKIHLIDSRNHVGGNCFDEEIDGILVHKYGPHIFHTHNKEVYDYLSGFTNWIEYKHKAKALLSDGRYVPFPVNKTTKEIVPEKDILDVFFRPYSRKMWNLELEELDPGIIKRVLVRNDRNEFYFPNALYQGLPNKGYTEMFKKMLNHKNISIELNTEFKKEMEDDYDFIFNSMSIDLYFNKQFGELEYRGMKFKSTTLPFPKLLPASVINFTHNLPYTRCTEWSQFPNSNKKDYTILTIEEPCTGEEGGRFYPIKDISGKNQEILKKYKDLAKAHPKMKFIGRTGLYVYIDMDQAVASALALAKTFLKKN